MKCKRGHSAVRAAKVCILGLVLVASCQERAALSAVAPTMDPWLFADYPAPTPVSREGMVPISLREIRRYGTEEGLGALDVVRRVVATDSVIVALLWRSCEFVVFSRSTGKALHRFGHCGQGPDDFSNMLSGTLAVRGDTLMVFDMLGRRARTISLSGKVLQTFTLDTAVVPNGATVSAAHVLSDSTVLLALDLLSHQRSGDSVIARLPFADYIRMARRDSWRLMASTLRDGPAVARQVYSLVRTPVSCVVGVPSGGQSLAAFNRWEPQLVVAPLEDLRRAALNGLLPISFPARATTAEPQSGIRSLARLGLACGDSVVLLSRSPVNATNAPPATAELFAYWPATETWGYTVVGESNEAALGRTDEGHGNRFFSVHNNRFEYPLIIETELVVGAAATPDQPARRVR